MINQLEINQTPNISSQTNMEISNSEVKEDELLKIYIGDNADKILKGEKLKIFLKYL